jgi:glycosyltransferase involved in cell wall biosynthesis
MQVPLPERFTPCIGSPALHLAVDVEAAHPGRFCLDSRWDWAQAGHMLGPTSCAAVIPCFNEGATVAALVREVRQHLSLIIVVDDGSTDGTSAVATAAGALVISHARNLGKGAALKNGVSAALTRGFEWVLTLDGDGQHRPQDVLAFLRCAEQAHVRLVVGNRMHNARSIPWLRRQVNRWMSRRLSERAGQSLPDSQCGFRLINLKVWASVPLETNHFEIESEMLLAFVRAGFRVEFVPIQVVGRGQSSHIHPVADSWRWWRWWRGLDRSSARPLQAGGARPG